MEFIAENNKYKVCSIDESIYLKKKKSWRNFFGFSKKYEFISHHYGNPNDGLITDNFVIFSGCGISIYDLKSKSEKHFFANGDKQMWTNGIHQDSEDDYHTEFRFVALNSENKLRVFKMNILSEILIELE